MTLNGVMAVTLHYFTEFGNSALQKTICCGIYARVYSIDSIVFLVRVQCRRKETSRSRSHLLMSFLLVWLRYVHLEEIRVKFVREGHLVKVKITGAKKREKSLFLQCKTSIDSNSDYIEDRAVNFTCSMGFSAMTDRMM